MGETWKHLLLTLSIPVLALILGLGWSAFHEDVLKKRYKD